MPFPKLLKFLHHLAFWVGFTLMLVFMYLTVKTWPDKPGFDPRVFWVVLFLAFIALFVYSFSKAWPLRPHLHFKNERVRRPQTPDDIEMFEKWKTIRQKAFGGKQDDMKQAILEADKVADKALENHGFTAPTTEEKILQILSEDLGWIRRIAQKANSYRNKIAENPAMEVEFDDVKKAIHDYEALLEELDIIDPRKF